MYLNEATLLHNLRVRYKKGQIYVRLIVMYVMYCNGKLNWTNTA